MVSTRASISSKGARPPTSPEGDESCSSRLAGFLSKLDGRGLLAVVSLDNIRWIMRQHGLHAGEQATQEFDTRLRKLVRAGDGYFQVSRDHVCLVFVGLFDHNHALLAANKLEQIFTDPLELAGAKVPLSARAGMASFVECASVRHADHLYRIAETAWEAAAQHGKCVEIISVEDQSTAQAHDLTPEFQKAMADGQVTLDYQPKYRLSDGDLVGAEALIRWRRDGAVMPPNEFICRLSQGQIWDMTKYCIRRAIREMQDFPHLISVALNIDPAALRHPEFLSFIRKELQLWSIAPQQLAFEITESATIDDYDQCNVVLSTLRSAGHRISIDDFGTGQATLQHFQNLPADEIKIDRQFITNLATDENDRSITKSIIEMAHRCGKTVVAEGIEDGNTVALLIELSCDIGQGFFLGMPMSREQFMTLIDGLGGPGPVRPT
jgi:EAL domain-containing protein (putative c-di-GMP-specific phosphodiesterase class I)/GGDEF domain-containing protein